MAVHLATRPLHHKDTIWHPGFDSELSSFEIPLTLGYFKTGTKC